VHNERLMPFRWKELGGRVLLTTDAGEHVWLEREAFGDFLAGTLPDDHPAFVQLQNHNLVRSSDAEKQLMDRIQARNRYLFLGPNLHIVILSLRCNQNCVYCHASRKPLKSKGFDMSLDTARRVVDVIFESPTDELTIEFQGGEPALNFDVLRFIIEEAYQRNTGVGRELEHLETGTD
jgi:uncharacterized protein